MPVDSRFPHPRAPRSAPRGILGDGEGEGVANGKVEKTCGDGSTVPDSEPLLSPLSDAVPFLSVPSAAWRGQTEVLRGRYVGRR